MNKSDFNDMLEALVGAVVLAGFVLVLNGVVIGVVLAAEYFFKLGEF